MVGSIKSSKLVTEYGVHTRDSSTANLALGKDRIAYYYTFILGQCNNYIIEKTKYGTTAAAQRSYLLPPDYIKMKTVRFHDGTNWNTLDEVRSIDRWNELTSVNRSVAIPTHWIIINESGNLHLEIDGLPVSNGANGNLEIVFEGYQDPLSFPSDYTTGTASINNGSASLTGVGTTFTSNMVGLFFKASGGKYWYDIKTFTDTTHLIFVNNFQESSISGSSYTIAELLRLPDEFSYTPLWGAIMDYYLPTNSKKAKEYEAKYARELLMIQDKFKSKTKGRITPGVPVGRGWPRVPRNYPNSAIG